MKKSIWPMVWLVIGLILLAVYIGGMIYIHFDYYASPHYMYGSTPISIYYILHTVFVLAPSLVCILTAYFLRRKSKGK